MRTGKHKTATPHRHTGRSMPLSATRGFLHSSERLDRAPLSTIAANATPALTRTGAAVDVTAGVMLFVAGSLVNVFAYQTLSLLLVALVFLFASLAALTLFSAFDEYERWGFVLVFAVCWFWAGVSALYATYSNDFFSDALYFFEEVTQGDGVAQDFITTLLFTENGAAIILWRLTYDFFGLLGVEEAPYVGISLNVCLVALTGVVGIKMVKAVFGNDLSRIQRFTLLFALCGLFWLYASIHIRDAAVLFSTTLLTLFWLYFLASPTIKNTAILAAATAVAILVFGRLRSEFFFVPIAMILAGTASFLFARQAGKKTGAALIAVAVLAVAATPHLIPILKSDTEDSLKINHEAYSNASLDDHGTGSLGNSLIINQPLPLRLLLGSGYLLVFPIPFWVGFQRESSYHLFKSLHVLFMYAVIPLCALSLWRISLVSGFRTRQALFLTFIFFGFLLSIAYTSLEMRHVGAFFVSFLVLSLFPDLSRKVDRRAYQVLLYLFLVVMAGIHGVWIFVKG